MDEIGKVTSTNVRSRKERLGLHIFGLLVGNFDQAQKTITVDQIQHMRMTTLRFDDSKKELERNWFHDKAKEYLLKSMTTIQILGTLFLCLSILCFAFYANELNKNVYLPIALSTLPLMAVHQLAVYLFLKYRLHYFTAIYEYLPFRLSMAIVPILVAFLLLNIVFFHAFPEFPTIYSIQSAMIVFTFSLEYMTIFELAVSLSIAIPVQFLCGVVVLYFLTLDGKTSYGSTVFELFMFSGYSFLGLFVGTLAGYRRELQKRIIILYKNSKASSTMTRKHVLPPPTNQLFVTRITDVLTANQVVPVASPTSQPSNHEAQILSTSPRPWHGSTKLATFIDKHFVLSFDDAQLENSFDDSFKQQSRDIFIPLALLFTLGQLFLGSLSYIRGEISFASYLIPTLGSILLLFVFALLVWCCRMEKRPSYSKNHVILVYYMLSITLQVTMPIWLMITEDREAMVADVIDLAPNGYIASLDKSEQASAILDINLIDRLQVALLIGMNAASSGVLRYYEAFILFLWNIFLALCVVTYIGRFDPTVFGFSLLPFFYAFIAKDYELLMREFFQLSHSRR